MILGLTDTCFLPRLLEADRELAKKAKDAGCLYCGGTLDVSNYARKPRGLKAEWEKAFCQRLSFCCRICRRRVTPVSLRFLGRKVYWALVLVSKKFRSLFEVPKKTLHRWEVFWKTIFSSHPFMKIVRGLVPGIGGERISEKVVCHYEGLYPGDYEETAFKSLQFFSPLSIKTSVLFECHF